MRLRDAFIRPRCFFASSRRLIDAFVGRVCLRFTGGGTAARNNCASLCRASMRLAFCVRCVLASIIIASSFESLFPAKIRVRAFTLSLSAVVFPILKRNCTALEVLLTFCPPGPEARIKLSVSSLSSIKI